MPVIPKIPGLQESKFVYTSRNDDGTRRSWKRFRRHQRRLHRAIRLPTTRISARKSRSSRTAKRSSREDPEVAGKVPESFTAAESGVLRSAKTMEIGTAATSPFWAPRRKTGTEELRADAGARNDRAAPEHRCAQPRRGRRRRHGTRRSQDGQPPAHERPGIRAMERRGRGLFSSPTFRSMTAAS